VPTVAEEGYPGFDATTWYGLAAPAKTPPAFIARANEDINRVLAMPEVIERLAISGAEDACGSAERFAEFMRNERSKYAKLVRDAGIKVDS